MDADKVWQGINELVWKWCDGEAGAMEAKGEIGRALAAARAEGYAEAKEQAAQEFYSRAIAMRHLAGQASGEKLRLERHEEADALESEARRIRAMEPKTP
jgi:uncharacterized protein involved in type VI secretion and phage assembly